MRKVGDKVTIKKLRNVAATDDVPREYIQVKEPEYMFTGRPRYRIYNGPRIGEILGDKRYKRED